MRFTIVIIAALIIVGGTQAIAQDASKQSPAQAQGGGSTCDGIVRGQAQTQCDRARFDGAEWFGAVGGTVSTATLFWYTGSCSAHGRGVLGSLGGRHLSEEARASCRICDDQRALDYLGQLDSLNWNDSALCAGIGAEFDAAGLLPQLIDGHI